MPPHTVRWSRGSAHIRLAVRDDGSVLLTLPMGVPEERGLDFLRSKEDWIRRSVAKAAGKELLPLRKEASLFLAEERLRHWNRLYCLAYQDVSVRDRRTRWGSCTRQGKLCFSARLAGLPERLSDYVIVHELCHLREMNHSARFWELVGRALPDYADRRKELRRYRLR